VLDIILESRCKLHLIKHLSANIKGAAITNDGWLISTFRYDSDNR